MKKLVAANKDACMACLQCVNSCSEAFYKRLDTAVAYLQIGAKNDGSPKVIACTQCGKCAKVCEYDAITQNAKGVYMVSRAKCTGCGKCVEVCPFNVMVLAADREIAGKCTACGICVKACPMDVLAIKES